MLLPRQQETQGLIMPCKCQGCYNLYKIDIEVPDSLWEIIKPKGKGKGKGAGLLCGKCIFTRLEKSNKYKSFNLIVS